VYRYVGVVHDTLTGTLDISTCVRFIIQTTLSTLLGSATFQPPRARRRRAATPASLAPYIHEEGVPPPSKGLLVQQLCPRLLTRSAKLWLTGRVSAQTTQTRMDHFSAAAAAVAALRNQRKKILVLVGTAILASGWRQQLACRTGRRSRSQSLSCHPRSRVQQQAVTSPSWRHRMPCPWVARKAAQRNTAAAAHVHCRDLHGGARGVRHAAALVCPQLNRCCVGPDAGMGGTGKAQGVDGRQISHREAAAALPPRARSQCPGSETRAAHKPTAKRLRVTTKASVQLSIPKS
jgi:hypothetical protein